MIIKWKLQDIAITESDVVLTENINRDIISNNKSEKRLGVTIHEKLTFDYKLMFLEAEIKLVKK